MCKVCEKCGHAAVKEYVRGDYFETKCYWCLSETSVKMFNNDPDLIKTLINNGYFDSILEDALDYEDFELLIQIREE